MTNIIIDYFNKHIDVNGQTTPVPERVLLELENVLIQVLDKARGSGEAICLERRAKDKSYVEVKRW